MKISEPLMTEVTGVPGKHKKTKEKTKMKDEKKLSKEEIKNEKAKNEELTDEQANEVTGGSYGPREHVARVKCTRCGRMVREDETIYTYVNGVRSITCFKCAGVR